ncbi:hypothetical protein [Cyanobium gracile]|uniref:Uncharacterized protein n=1 Tax=Cyanobium gracile (strain ATCC 27147 / PCC 6307) TaxID=292564 RepID=K9P545_CYAGP|nr:hypothetical protein [Cyanobium gracile]AFY28230.1 hypothetical protein Cyagr_1049 [Cyanobium gracile PCC 6307]
MKASLPHWRHLRLPLLGALALNGLLVVAALRPPARTAPAVAAPPPDDTPELLRFSRQQAREPALAALPLPPLSALPPPPPTDLPAQPRRRADRGADRARPAAATPAPPGAGQERTGARTGAELAATTRMLALALQARTLESAEATAVATLWEQATPTREAPAGMAAAPEGMELRRLPLAKARSAGLASSDPLAVLAGGKVLLLWPDGSTFWLLAAASDSRTSSARP